MWGGDFSDNINGMWSLLNVVVTVQFDYEPIKEHFQRYFLLLMPHRQEYIVKNKNDSWSSSTLYTRLHHLTV